ncbi:hypothetical protein MTO96_030674 [Rhipicephalus appendiculatus]
MRPKNPELIRRKIRDQHKSNSISSTIEKKQAARSNPANDDIILSCITDNLQRVTNTHPLYSEDEEEVCARSRCFESCRLNIFKMLLLVLLLLSRGAITAFAHSDIPSYQRPWPISSVYPDQRRVLAAAAVELHHQCTAELSAARHSVSHRGGCCCALRVHLQSRRVPAHPGRR